MEIRGTCRLISDRHANLQTRRITAIDHGFAVSIHRSQGCTVDRSFVLDSRTMDANLIYVALTRHKEETALYTAPEITRMQIRHDRPFVAVPDFRTRTKPLARYLRLWRALRVEVIGVDFVK